MDNFLTTISGINISEKREVILSIIENVLGKSQMELISADEKLEQTMIVIVILYAYALSDKSQWENKTKKGTVVYNILIQSRNLNLYNLKQQLEQ